MRRQLAIVFAAVASMITLAFVVPLAISTRNTAHDRAIDHARATTAQLVRVVATRDATRIAPAIDAAIADNHQATTVYLEDGTVIGTELAQDAQVEVALAEGRTTLVDRSGGKVLVTAVVTNDDSAAAIRIAIPDRQLNLGVMQAWLVFGLLSAALITLSVAIADRIARRLTRPIAELANAARQLGSGDLDARVRPDGPRELRDTAHAFNTLASDVTTSISRERATITDLAHQLRTPLTKLRLDADRTGNTEIADGVDCVNAVLSEFIRSRRVDADRVGRCDAARVIGERCEFWRGLANDEHRSFDVDLPRYATPVAIPAGDLEAAFDVVIDNVFTHTPPATPCRVTLRTTGDHCTLTIVDKGAGLGNAVVAHERPSSGLGLTIVRRLADRHHGHFELFSSADGTTAELRIPVERPV